MMVAAVTLLQLALLVMIAHVVRWRGLLTCEGVGLSLFGLAVASDLLGLFWYISTVRVVIDNHAEFAMRLLPNCVALVGVLSFWAGLSLVPPVREYRMSWTRGELDTCGWVMLAGGLGMKIYALYSWGFTSLMDYFVHTYAYDTQKHGGGFWDLGLDIAMLGAALLITARPRSRTRLFFFGFVVLALAFILSSSKSGLNTALIISATAIYTFTPDLFKKLWRPSYMSGLALVFFIGLGIKTQVKYSGTLADGSPSVLVDDILDSASVTMSRRFSAFGNYRGYCNLVDRIHASPQEAMRGTVLAHLVTDWVPRFLWPTKPEHPFHAVGLLVNDDFHTDENSNDAPTLVGFAYADYGLPSAVGYLLFGGIIIGFLGRLRNHGGAASQIAWIFFAVHLGLALPESGLLSLSYYMVFSALLFVALRVLLAARRVVVRGSLRKSARTVWEQPQAA